MKYKVYVPLKNVTWNNNYFDIYLPTDNTVKTNFINNYFGEDIPDKFTILKDSALIRSDYLNASIAIGVQDKDKNGNNIYSINEVKMLSKNYLITQSDNITIEYWFITKSFQFGNIIQFTLELDIGMSLNWNNMFEGEALIDRAHIDRYKKVDSNIIPIFDINSNLMIAEDIKISDKNFYPKSLEYIKDSILTGWDKEDAEIMKGMTLSLGASNSIKTGQTATNGNWNTLEDDSARYQGNIFFWNSSVGLVPVIGQPSLEDGVVGTQIDLTGGSAAAYDGGTTFGNAGAYQIPWPNTLFNRNSYPTLKYDVVPTIEYDEPNSYIYKVTWVDSSGNNITTGCMLPVAGQVESYNPIIATNQVQISKIKPNLITFDSDPASNYNGENETKLYYPQFYKIRLMGHTTNQFDLLIPYLFNGSTLDVLSLDCYLNIQLGGMHTRWIPTDGFYKDIAPKYNLWLENETNFEYNVVNNTYQQNIIANQNSRSQAISYAKQSELIGISKDITTSLLGMTGVRSLLISSKAQLVGGAAGVVGTTGMDVLGTVARYENTLHQQQAQVTDWKDTPNKTTSNGNTITMSIFQKSVYPNVYELELFENTKQAVINLFNTQGYQLGLIKEINDIIQSRYWFNFLKANTVIDNIKESLSLDTKILIEKLIKKGVTFWHVRDNNGNLDYLSIKDYTKNNLEVSLHVTNRN